ncbi:unnamed protein product, partial [marine sediment metagenome]
SEKPLVGYKRLWAFVYLILALATNLLYVGYVIIPNVVKKTLYASDYMQWVLVNFFLIIILMILFFAKFILVTFAKVEDKVTA